MATANIYTTACDIGGRFHRFIATTWGKKTDVVFDGYHFDGYALNNVLHIDMGSSRPLSRDEWKKRSPSGEVIPFNRRITSDTASQV